MLLAGFAILGTTEPDFYRGSATGIPRKKISTLHVQKKFCKIFWYTPTAGSNWKASGLQNKLSSTSAPNFRSSF